MKKRKAIRKRKRQRLFWFFVTARITAMRRYRIRAVDAKEAENTFMDAWGTRTEQIDATADRQGVAERQGVLFDKGRATPMPFVGITAKRLAADVQAEVRRQRARKARKAAGR